MTQATPQLNLIWVKCGNEMTWCPLNTVGLNHETFSQGGVYVIWQEGDTSRADYVGQAAVIRDRLEAHRAEPAIQAYASRGMLLVTWAHAAAAQRDGIEMYLAGQTNPMVGKRYPDAVPISVNLPWP